MCSQPSRASSDTWKEPRFDRPASAGCHPRHPFPEGGRRNSAGSQARVAYAGRGRQCARRRKRPRLTSVLLGHSGGRADPLLGHGATNRRHKRGRHGHVIATPFDDDNTCCQANQDQYPGQDAGPAVRSTTTRSSTHRRRDMPTVQANWVVHRSTSRATSGAPRSHRSGGARQTVRRSRCRPAARRRTTASETPPHTSPAPKVPGKAVQPNGGDMPPLKLRPP